MPYLSNGWINYDPVTGDFYKNVLSSMPTNIAARVRNNPRKFTVSEHGYLVTSKDKKLYYLHRIAAELLYSEIPSDMYVDHINGDKRDNRACNLRIVTKQQSAMNVSGTHKTSRYKGVHNYRGRWKAFIEANGVRHNLGTYDTEVDAAVAYNYAAADLHGEYARLNDIDQGGKI